MDLVAARRVLGLSCADPTPEQVSRAYRISCLKSHPDRGGSTLTFIEATEARDALMEGVMKQDGGLFDFVAGKLENFRIVQRSVMASFRSAYACQVFLYSFEGGDYAVPLWKRTAYFPIPDGVLVVRVKLVVPSHVTVKADNSIHVHKTTSVAQLLKSHHIRLGLGDPDISVNVGALPVAQSQAAVVKGYGLPKPGPTLGVTVRSDLVLHLMIDNVKVAHLNQKAR